MDNAIQQVCYEVGRGQCGTVFALDGTNIVIKILNNSSKEDELFTDYQLHQIIYNAFKIGAIFRPAIYIPRCQAWVDPKTDMFWNSKTASFPKDTRTPNFGLISERIPPVPLHIREAIVDTLCPKEIKRNKVEFLNKLENQDCLVRIYLGRRSDSRTTDASKIRLRNFPLHVDEMERLGLDPKGYTVTMAETLALLHWTAGIDANDVEFVLGSSPVVSGLPTQQEMLEATKHTASQRDVSMWLLDFNECKGFTYGEDNVKQLVDGFWINDPYYPRPSATETQDKMLWELFMKRYLEASSVLVTHKGPRAFIDGVIERGNKHSVGSLFG